MARWLMAAGVLLLLLGVALHYAPGLLNWFGKLPGDIRIEYEEADFREGGRFLFGVGNGWNRDEMAARAATELRDGEYVPMEVRTETIKVAGGDDVEVTVRETVHGPILSDVVEQIRDLGTDAAQGGVEAERRAAQLQRQLLERHPRPGENAREVQRPRLGDRRAQDARFPPFGPLPLLGRDRSGGERRGHSLVAVG